MHRRFRLLRVPATLFGLMVATMGCGGQAGPSDVSSASTIRTHSDTRVITSLDGNGTTVPLVEVFPALESDPAVLRLAFDATGNLGIEGGVAFASAYALDGTLVLDRMVDLEGDSVETPAGDFTIRLYFRPCDGFCGLLDPDVEFCTFEQELVPGELYEVNVTGGGFGQPAARCSVNPET
ncbi:MAG TPA: hypothetical protein VFW95_05720 [Candidatus Limnocylindria bacterium]|nr:hypothetical protein [Candidatus Limnocylindria bacterium]